MALTLSGMASMNREQMIAWLALEGWEPMAPPNTARTAGRWLYRDGYVAYVASGCTNASFRKWGKSLEVQYTYPGFDPFEDAELILIYEKLSNQMP